MKNSRASPTLRFLWYCGDNFVIGEIEACELAVMFSRGFVRDRADVDSLAVDAEAGAPSFHVLYSSEAFMAPAV
jgi:hypothetical protein